MKQWIILKIQAYSLILSQNHPHCKICSHVFFDLWNQPTRNKHTGNDKWFMLERHIHRECTQTCDRKVPEKIRNWWIFEDLQIFTDFYARHFFPALSTKLLHNLAKAVSFFLTMYEFNANSRVPFKRNSVAVDKKSLPSHG